MDFGSENRLLTRKNIVTIVIVLLLIAGVAVGVYLVQTQQIFKSRATGAEIEIKDAEGRPLPTRNVGGTEVPITTSNQIKIQLNPPAR